jgi:hypothetical protein
MELSGVIPMQIGFIDFSKEERNKILATLKLLGTQTALDELGIGVIRDAYADILFPGISTIQTRAKYFVLIPYLFNRAGNQNLSGGREVLRWINNSEDKLVETLLKNSKSEETGIIGKNALRQKRAVKMKPSSIYWNGLRTFEIIRASGASMAAACTITAKTAKQKNDLEIKTEGETFDDSAAIGSDTVLFSPISPDYDFENKASILLTKKEAEYLADKISKAIASKDTLLAFLVKNKLDCNSFDEMPIDILPASIKRDYLLARDFSDFIIGAHIRYNVIFSEYEDIEMIQEWENWRNAFIARKFDLEAILSRITCNNSTQKFCKDFMELTYSGHLEKIDELIIFREKAVKGDRAKLHKPAEYRYNYDRPVHFYRLDFRFGTSKTIIRDIIIGLEG